MREIQKVEYNGTLVLTTQQIAEAYGTTDKIISNNFNNNKERYTDGKHYICLIGDELKDFKNHSLNLGIAPQSAKLYLWTKKGAFLHAKSLNTDTAWEVYDRLVDDYFEKRQQKHQESLESINNTINIFSDLQKKAGCPEEIQLLTAKTIFEEFTGKRLPLMVKADKQYYDTEYIARQLGIYVKSSGKPAEKAVNEIIRRIDITDDMCIETWETSGKWQGTVRKYSQEVIEMARKWCSDNGYPNDIEYIQSDGQKKKYHVKWNKSA